MAIVDTGDDLLEESSRVRLLQFAVLDDVVEQLAAGYIFHDHKNIGRRTDHLVQFDDVRMTKQLQVLNLTPDLSDHVEIFDFLSVQNLDGHLIAGTLMPGGCTREGTREVQLAFESNALVHFR